METNYVRISDQSRLCSSPENKVGFATQPVKLPYVQDYNYKCFDAGKDVSRISEIVLPGLMYMWSLPMTDCYYTILEGNFIMQSAAERFWWLEPLDNNGQCYYGSCHVLRSPQASQSDFAV
ncbi:uncharacterized protein [Dysidea avara]|uniref:uncharacterized protein isoform X2 n=1 Tax=Dysidea avara TaxID=196820 RepID=UPI0033326B97